MQFHLNGFQPGDPRISVEAPVKSGEHRADGIAEPVDVLIVGCGPAGLTLAAQLAAFPDIRTRIVEQKPGRILLGQADGIACRTVEMFEAFGFADQVRAEGYWVNEVSFWGPSESDRGTIVRNGRIQDVEDGLSEMPHVILNQARVHDFYLELMRHSPSAIEPDYGRRLIDLTIEPSVGAPNERQEFDRNSYPVKVRLERIDPKHEGEIETVNARFVVGCDGARSRVRECLRRALSGDSANQAWGVMDVLAVTDFPDIRLKATIHSADEGSVLVIPREGGYLVRLYVEMDKLNPNERVANRNITAEHLIAAAQRILRPYTLEVKEVAWWSVYEIGQRLTDKFDDVPQSDVGERLPRVFIAGDACHTHSPKAGQGMNVSMQDTFNLGWKLASVLRDQSVPQLLHTYSDERQAIAQELIDFDREMARLFSARPKDPADPDGEGIDPEEFRGYFARQLRFTAGTATKYQPSLITGQSTHQSLATGLVIGMRFHSAPVVRLADARQIELGHVIKADGRWRIFAFASADDPHDPGAPIYRLCEFLASSGQSPVRRYTPQEADPDSIFDVRAVFQQRHRELSLERMPSFLLPRKGRYGLIDYEKMFCPDLKSGEDIFDTRGIDRERGCIVVVRPDQYIANVLPLDAYTELATFFERFMVPAGSSGACEGAAVLEQAG